MEDTGNTSDTPQGIADEFKAAARAVDAESGTDITGAMKTKGTRKPKEEKKDVATEDLPKWTPKGIGMVIVAGHDAVFNWMDLPKLEDEERDAVSTQWPRFLNAIWPQGGQYEPHAAALLTELQVLYPRAAAYMLRKKQEQERERQNAERPPEGNVVT